MNQRAHTALAAIFFLSGAASLLFETLWFRLCGIVFGNSAWATAIVLGSFMAGLAIGNVLSPRIGRTRPLRAYAALEFTVAASGLILVLILPFLSRGFAPLFRALIDTPFLNAARLILAFVLLVIPSTVMGATLPTMVGALSHSDENFGRVLGLLYGCNTMGAVVGALIGELLLIRVFGVRATGVVAALGSATAGFSALRIPMEDSRPRLSPPTGQPRAAVLHWRLLGAACCAGFSLLALEVIWFRFVTFFTMSTSVSFAVMLAVVLAGIGFGALVSSAALSRMVDADRYTAIVAAAAVIAVIVSYSGFNAAPKGRLVAVIIDSLRLMLPVSILSGMLFTGIGRAIEREIGDEVRAAARTTFANTIGAALGPLAAGFVMLPALGIERSLFAIALLYAVIAILTMRDATPRTALIVTGALAVIAVATFPFGLFRNEFLPFATRAHNGRIVAVREGPIETAVYLRTDYAGEPYLFRLFTNGYSMSATSFPSRRYMSEFVYLPIALRPQIKDALLISYGVGITAKAMTSSPQLRSIDIVDISRNILELSSLVWPGGTIPLADPRVRVHVEDGRFFLLTTSRRFDLITAEPPPPKSAGVVNLYTREHFQLIRDHLTGQGIASYWLPVYQMSESDNKAIVRAFCDVFSDCSLWTGSGAEWILVGSREPITAPPSDTFAAQWKTASGITLSRIGIESPAQMAATFIADAPMLHAMTSDALPVTDDHPLRLSPDPIDEGPPFILPMLDAAPRAFQQSVFVRQALPADVRAAALPLFPYEQLFDRLLMMQSVPTPSPALLESLLTKSNQHALPRLMFGSDAWLEDIARDVRARGSRDPRLAYILAVGALADRDYVRAKALFGEAANAMPGNRELRAYEALADRLSR